MSISMNQVRLRFIPYNARLIDARKSRGLRQSDLAIMCGISTAYMGHIETLRVIPSSDTRQEICSALQLEEDYLFPDALMAAVKEGLFEHRLAELEGKQIIRLTETRQSRMLPPHITDEEMVHLAEQSILKDKVKQILHKLTPRERAVIEARFGLGEGGAKTLDEVASMFGVTRERVRQIEVKALRKLRHPSISQSLKDFL